MIATSGPSFTGLSPSSVLSESLGSRLRRRLDSIGSTEYRQTWKRMATRSGRLYWAHTASGRPRSASDSTGWPTPNARDWKDTPGMATQGVNPDGSVRNRLDMLPRVAQQVGLTHEAEAALTGWPSPSADGSAGETSEDLERVGNKWVNRKTGRVLQTNLATDAKMLVGWTTPQAHDATMRGAGQTYEKNGAGNKCLARDATLTGWPTPTDSMVTEQDLVQVMSAGNGKGREGYAESQLMEPRLAGWLAPTVTTKDTGVSETLRNGSDNLSVIAQTLAPNPQCLSGQDLESPTAGMEKPGASPLRPNLNPFFSAWLMGFPTAWTLAGLSAKPCKPSRSPKVSPVEPPSCAATETP